MSGLVATSALWRREDTASLTSHVLHGHVPRPLAVGFSPPGSVMNLKSGPSTSPAVVARMAALRGDTPVEVLTVSPRSTNPKDRNTPHNFASRIQRG
jgi:hypothetical protein